MRDIPCLFDTHINPINSLANYFKIMQNLVVGIAQHPQTVALKNLGALSVVRLTGIRKMRTAIHFGHQLQAGAVKIDHKMIDWSLPNDLVLAHLASASHQVGIVGQVKTCIDGLAVHGWLLERLPGRIS